MDSDLFEFVKHKTHAVSLAVSPDGKLFAATSNDRKIRVFRFLSGEYWVCKNWLPDNCRHSRGRPAQSGERPPTNPAIQVQYSTNRRDFFWGGNLRATSTSQILLSQKISITPSTGQKGKRTLHNLDWAKGNVACKIGSVARGFSRGGPTAIQIYYATLQTNTTTNTATYTISAYNT